MSKFIASWLNAAAEILKAELSQPVDLMPGAGLSSELRTIMLVAEIAGDWSGSFRVTADRTALSVLLEADADALDDRWQSIFRKVVIAAAEALGKSSGRACEVAMISAGSEAGSEAGNTGFGYQLRSGERVVLLTIADAVALEQGARTTAAAGATRPGTAVPTNPATNAGANAAFHEGPATAPRENPAMKSTDLLLDVELEASLRFGAREMSLNEILELGPGDVVQLDRHVDDPVDLIVGDKIVARGEVVLVNGNFGLQILEVAEPRRRLESIRCLF